MAQADKTLARAGAALLGVAGALIWAVARTTWVDVEYVDDLSGAGTAAVRGADWSTETVAVAVLLIAGMAAGFALRRVGRRVVGAIAALASAGVAVPAAQLLVRGADTERARAILTAGAEQSGAGTAGSGSGSGADTIAQWAEITSATVVPLGPALTLAGAAIGLVGGLLLVFRPGADSPRQNKYEKESVRREKVRSDLEQDPQSGRVLWDAISADIDPTDPAGR